MAISQIVQNSLANTISLGAKIQSVQVANSTYVVKDDTAVNVGGGYIVITGSGFQSNCSVLVSDGTTSNLACSVSFVSSTQVNAQVPAKSAGTYTVYLINGDGGTAIRVNSLQYSNTPTWVTTSPLDNQLEDSNVSIQLSATGANTYSLQTGSTLPTGLTLSANGLISGTVNTDVSVDTTYNFTVEAIDTENQETPKAFSVTITVGDPYFYLTTLLLDGNGTSGANNNVVRDSSNNNYTITRANNLTQGTFSPFSLTGWSNYFDGNGDYLSRADNAAWHLTGDFTIEAWVYMTATSPLYDAGVVSYGSSSSLAGWFFGLSGSNAGGTQNRLIWSVNYSAAGGAPVYGTNGVSLNRWTHIAATKSGNTVRLFIDGVLDTTATVTATPTTNAAYSAFVGTASYDPGSTDRSLTGYISNLRVVKGQALYTSAFTPSTAALTTTSQSASSANVSLLTCQSNRFLDNSTNAFALTRNGNVIVYAFSPFAPTAAYSAETNGGSLYFDGDADVVYATEASSQFTFGTGDFEYECWFYNDRAPSYASQETIFARDNTGNINVPYIYITASRNLSVYYTTGISTGTSTVRTGEWNHLLVSRVSGTIRIFLNGVQESSDANNTDLVAAGKLVVGGQWTGNSNMFKGWISGVRVRKGSGSTSVTVPTTPPTAIANTNLLLLGTNAGIYDLTSRNVIETVGDARVNTSISKFGTGSVFFDGTGDYLSLPNNPSYLFGTGDFTVECWFYPNALTGTPGANQAIIGMWGGVTSQASWLFYLNAGNLYWYTSTNGSTQTATMNAASGMSAGNWYHLALVRYSGTTKIYVNGTSIVSTSSTVDLYNANCTLTIGYNPIGGTPDYVYGNIDDLRITKGYARYTSNFTPPTSAFVKR